VFGDVALAIGSNFTTYFEVVIATLNQASVTTVDKVSEFGLVLTGPTTVIQFVDSAGNIYMFFADPKPVNNFFIFFQALKRKKTRGKKTNASVTVTVVRDRKIRTALRTNQIAGFVTVSAWKK